ncbi:MAG: hypothetical protein AB7D96_10945 [Arcobacteraceae bacterium]
MKNYILLLVAFIFIGCSQKDVTYKSSQEVFEKPMQKEVTPSYEEVFKPKEDHFFQSELKNKIAIIFPSKVVGKYANGTINTVLSQLFLDEIEFNLEVIDIYDESYESIENALNELYEKKYKTILLLTTNEGLSFLENMDKAKEFTFFVPLVHKKNSASTLNNIVYGGIDYEQQIETLFSFSNGKEAVFSTQTPLGNRLRTMILEKSSKLYLDTIIDLDKNNYKHIVTNKNLTNSTLFMNTSIIKTSILLSQLRAYETEPAVILSTQLNYTPLIISLTQYLDRKNFLIANSIESVDFKIEETAALLDADIVYNWVNYSTLIGINYLLKKNPFIYNPIINNQVQYRTTIYKNTAYGFRKHTN